MANGLASNGNNSPTYQPPQPSGLTPVLERNIEALYKRRKREEQASSLQERAADAITRFTGSMSFVYLHLLIFGLWDCTTANDACSDARYEAVFISSKASHLTVENRRAVPYCLVSHPIDQLPSGNAIEEACVIVGIPRSARPPNFFWTPARRTRIDKGAMNTGP
jgi:hypothetical protein